MARNVLCRLSSKYLHSACAWQELVRLGPTYVKLGQILSCREDGLYEGRFCIWRICISCFLETLRGTMPRTVPCPQDLVRKECDPLGFGGPALWGVVQQFLRLLGSWGTAISSSN